MKKPVDGFCPNAGYKQDRFSKTLLEKSLKLVLSKKNNIIIFDPSLILLPKKPILLQKNKTAKSTQLEPCSIGRIKNNLCIANRNNSTLYVILYSTCWGF